LSGLAAEKNYPEFRATLREGLGHLVFVNLLASVLLVVLAEPIVRLLFERGQFTADSTHRAAAALACLAPGLALFSTVNVLARAFYALGDTKVPMKISVFCLGLNLFCAVWLIGPFRQAGLGLANTLSSAANVWLLSHALRRKLSRLEWEPLRPVLLALAGATLAAGAVGWVGSWLWQNQLGCDTLLRKCGQVFVPMTAAVLLYWGLACWLRVPQAREIGGLLLRRFRG
jgi:putative peptidoglycan lipid II flippase